MGWCVGFRDEVVEDGAVGWGGVGGCMRVGVFCVGWADVVSVLCVVGAVLWCVVGGWRSVVGVCGR